MTTVMYKGVKTDTVDAIAAIFIDSDIVYERLNDILLIPDSQKNEQLTIEDLKFIQEVQLKKEKLNGKDRTLIRGIWCECYGDWPQPTHPPKTKDEE